MAKLWDVEYSWFYQAMKKAEDVGRNRVKNGVCFSTFDKEFSRVSGRAVKVALKIRRLKQGRP